jgi:hypothetical protein
VAAAPNTNDPILGAPFNLEKAVTFPIDDSMATAGVHGRGARAQRPLVTSAGPCMRIPVLMLWPATLAAFAKGQQMQLLRTAALDAAAAAKSANERAPQVSTWTLCVRTMLQQIHQERTTRTCPVAFRVPAQGASLWPFGPCSWVNVGLSIAQVSAWACGNRWTCSKVVRRRVSDAWSSPARTVCFRLQYTIVTLKRMCCQMHYNVLLCGFWDPDFRIQRTILA